MCAAPNSTNVPNSSPQSHSTSNPVSTTSTNGNQNRRNNQKPKRYSHGKRTEGTTGSTSNSSSQKSSAQPNNESRNAKRARWAKKSKPVAKPVVKRGPEKEYISLCCSVPARKPHAGTKEPAKDPESGRIKDQVKGLGHWRCGQCGKVCKVSAQKAVPHEAKNSPAMPSPPTLFIPPALEALTLAASFPVAPPGVIARIVTFGGPDAKV